MRRSILFVAMQMSAHTVRWINQITDQNWDVHLFPVNYLPVCPELCGVTVHQPWMVLRPIQTAKRYFQKRWKGREKESNGLRSEELPSEAIYPLPVLQWMPRYLNGIKYVSLGPADARAPAAYGPRVLTALLRKIKPDLIHSLEFQHCGYLVLKAREYYGDGFPKWLATNWGSDIYYYRRFDDHKQQISRLLQCIDYYSCECERDVALARELGYSGRVMPVMPNAGGFDIKMAGRLRTAQVTSQRKVIMVKGYQHFVGRALTALRAVEQCAPLLEEFETVVFSASPEIHGRVAKLRDNLGLNIRIMPHSSHDRMLRMFSRARVYLGVSESDAISTSMLEALAMGAFPIQTQTSCCDEWFENTQGGFLIPFDDVDVIAERLRRALLDDPLVDRAAEINWQTVQVRLDQKELKQKAAAFYHEIFK